MSNERVECTCNAYVRFGTRICVCGARRILSREEAIAAGFNVDKGSLRETRHVSSAGRKRDPRLSSLLSSGMVTAYRMTDRDFEDKD